MQTTVIILVSGPFISLVCIKNIAEPLSKSRFPNCATMFKLAEYSPDLVYLIFHATPIFCVMVGQCLNHWHITSYTEHLKLNLPRGGYLPLAKWVLIGTLPVYLLQPDPRKVKIALNIQLCKIIKWLIKPLNCKPICLGHVTEFLSSWLMHWRECCRKLIL